METLPPGYLAEKAASARWNSPLCIGAQVADLQARRLALGDLRRLGAHAVAVRCEQQALTVKVFARRRKRKRAVSAHEQRKAQLRSKDCTCWEMADCEMKFSSATAEKLPRRTTD